MPTSPTSSGMVTDLYAMGRSGHPLLRPGRRLDGREQRLFGAMRESVPEWIR